MIVLTGDTHREFERIEAFCEENCTTKNDVLVILGDAGVNFFLDESDENLKRWMSGLPITFFCVHGNHEERPFNIDTYEEQLWHGGLVYVEPEFPSLLFAKDGEIYDFGGKKVVVLGGAYSVDKFHRLYHGAPWFPDEQPDEEIKRYAEAQLEKAGWRVDYVLSHAAPLQYDPRHADDCIYSPGVVICKTDEAVPKRLPPEEFVTVDVISCAAPDLRTKKRDGMFVEIDRRTLDDLHEKRAEHILRLAAAKGINVLVLGAFGCGVFENKPETVARAWFKVLMSYKKYFDRVEFAVYCRDKEYDDNFKAFQREKNYCDDEVTVIDSGEAAREEFGELFGGYRARVSQEQIDALQNGKQLAIKVNDEYMLFLEGPKR